jgi:hypothetical protein
LNSCEIVTAVVLTIWLQAKKSELLTPHFGFGRDVVLPNFRRLHFDNALPNLKLKEALDRTKSF